MKRVPQVSPILKNSGINIHTTKADDRVFPLKGIERRQCQLVTFGNVTAELNGRHSTVTTNISRYTSACANEGMRSPE